MDWRFPSGLVAGMLALAMQIDVAMALADPPGVTRDPALSARLAAAYDAMPEGYEPRTHLYAEDGRAKYVNRLIEEASPYLLQHAHNPVDWHPWSDETLAKAQAEGKPIFLSVGYATCHWCHVMEEESFDNEDVAAVLNAGFIAIKIDREAQPDLDHLYITATQIQMGGAGWPNSVWLLPDGRPFHTGTYIPRPEFMQIANAIALAWTDPTQRGEIDTIAANLSEAVAKVTQLRGAQSALLDEMVHVRAAEQLLGMHNALEGGFSQSTQFPQEGYLLFLMDHWRRTGDQASLQVATETLDAIAAGGIHDHVGGGFHRYAVDPNWRTPHFEKMLYNQGLLARAFVEAWEITGTARYRRAAERTFAYVARDMTDPDGAFYAAEDADSRAEDGTLEEGVFYAWTPAQILAALPMNAEGSDQADPVTALGIDQPPTLDVGGVIHFDPFSETDLAAFDPYLETLRVVRDARTRPLRDDKVIAGWNGLMIRALAEGGAAFGEPRYVDMAVRAGAAIWSRLWSGDRLARLWAAGQAHEDAVLEDYAWLGLAFVALSDATGDPVWLARAEQLFTAMQRFFADGSGRYKMAMADGPLGPIYNSSDGATPSGESSALELFARLFQRTQSLDAEGAAHGLRSALAGALSHQPILRTDALTAIRILEGGETGRRRMLSGVVGAHLHAGGLTLDIAEGWHVNAHDPGQEWLIGVVLDGADAAWPVGKTVTLGFSDEALNVYEGRLEIPVTYGEAREITLTVQACSDEICRQPVTATFRLL
ncbi:MAG: DUF255 domain-containing protein [Pseudomonadota bacterium]